MITTKQKINYKNIFFELLKVISSEKVSVFVFEFALSLSLCFGFLCFLFPVFVFVFVFSFVILNVCNSEPPKAPTKRTSSSIGAMKKTGKSAVAKKTRWTGLVATAAGGKGISKGNSNKERDSRRGVRERDDSDVDAVAFNDENIDRNRPVSSGIIDELRKKTKEIENKLRSDMIKQEMFEGIATLSEVAEVLGEECAKEYSNHFRKLSKRVRRSLYNDRCWIKKLESSKIDERFIGRTCVTSSPPSNFCNRKGKVLRAADIRNCDSYRDSRRESDCNDSRREWRDSRGYENRQECDNRGYDNRQDYDDIRSHDKRREYDSRGYDERREYDRLCYQKSNS